MRNNILFIENSLLPSRGGIEKVTYKLSECFTKNKYNCFFAFQYVDYNGILEEKKFRFNHSDNKHTYYKKFDAFINKNNINIIIIQGITQRKLIHTLKKLKKIYNFQLIYCLHNTPQYIHHLPRPKKGIDLIKISIKTLMYGFIHPYIKEQQMIYNLCDNYIVLSKSFIEEAKKEFSFPNIEKINYIGNPLMSNVNGQVDIKEKKKEVLIIARFDENQKNIIGALNIWKQIADCKKDWSLIIVGYGEYEDVYRKYIFENSISNVKIQGKSENPDYYYRRASIFMMTSHYEGLAITLIEALQYKCIPIAYNTFSSIHDLIINNSNGFIIPAYDVKAYINKLLIIMNNPDVRVNMMNNSSITLSSFTDDNIINKWMTVLNK